MNTYQGKTLDRKIESFMSRKLDKFPELTKKDRNDTKFRAQLPALKFTTH